MDWVTFLQGYCTYRACLTFDSISSAKKNNEELLTFIEQTCRYHQFMDSSTEPETALRGNAVDSPLALLKM